MTAVLLVDDDVELDQMLTEYFAAESIKVIPAVNGAAALQRLAEQPFDLVILDVMLPALNGFEVLRRLRQSFTIPVIMLTARGEDNDRILGFELGTDDYLPKPFNPLELLARIRAVLRRTSNESKTTQEIAIGAVRLEPALLKVTVDGHPLQLTGAEFRMLELLMRAPGQIQSRDSLTERVLGRKYSAIGRSIDTHISNLRRKLAEQKGGVEIRNIRGAGYVLTGITEARP
jgi:DNA-binding response OmpR family regulator